MTICKAFTSKGMMSLPHMQSKAKRHSPAIISCLALARQKSARRLSRSMQAMPDSKASSGFNPMHCFASSMPGARPMADGLLSRVLASALRITRTISTASAILARKLDNMLANSPISGLAKAMRHSILGPQRPATISTMAMLVRRPRRSA